MAAPHSPIHASAFVSTRFANVKTGLSYDLVRADSVSPSDTHLQTICSICNEPAVYDFLFQSLLGGQPYPLEKAKGFLEWAKRGWAEEKYFVFLITDSQGRIAGALDIKSNNPGGAEIGYWASSSSSGIMTPAVGALCELAAESGFSHLFAFVKTTNQRSVAVLERNGFTKSSQEDLTKSYPRYLYEKKL